MCSVQKKSMGRGLISAQIAESIDGLSADKSGGVAPSLPRSCYRITGILNDNGKIYPVVIKKASGMLIESWRGQQCENAEQARAILYDKSL